MKTAPAGPPRNGVPAPRGGHRDVRPAAQSGVGSRQQVRRLMTQDARQYPRIAVRDSAAASLSPHETARRTGLQVLLKPPVPAPGPASLKQAGQRGVIQTPGPHAALREALDQ